MSVLHIAKGDYSGTKVLDGTNVDTITAFLFHRGGHADPVRLQANAGKSFQGSTVLGMGFTFDDTDKKGVASPLAEMHRLIEADPHNREAIFPYIGGEEVNTSPTHSHHRYVINFHDYPLRREESPVPWADMGEQERDECLRSGRVPNDYPDPVAADWPELLHIVETRSRRAHVGTTRQHRGGTSSVGARTSTPPLPAKCVCWQLLKHPMRTGAEFLASANDFWPHTHRIFLRCLFRLRGIPISVPRDLGCISSGRQ